MAPRKQRLRVVLDTNVWVSFFLGGSQPSAVAEIVRLWRNLRQLQLIVSEELLVEYLRVLRRLEMNELVVARFAESLTMRSTVTFVNLGPRVVASRDPDDNLLLTVAQSGRASYLVTSDRDLLELTRTQRQRLRFEIVRPAELIRRIR